MREGRAVVVYTRTSLAKSLEGRGCSPAPSWAARGCLRGMGTCRVLQGRACLPLKEKQAQFGGGFLFVCFFKGAQHVVTLPLTGFFLAVSYPQEGVLKCPLLLTRISN